MSILSKVARSFVNGHITRGELRRAYFKSSDRVDDAHLRAALAPFVEFEPNEPNKTTLLSVLHNTINEFVDENGNYRPPAPPKPVATPQVHDSETERTDALAQAVITYLDDYDGGALVAAYKAAIQTAQNSDLGSVVSTFLTGRTTDDYSVYNAALEVFRVEAAKIDQDGNYLSPTLASAVRAYLLDITSENLITLKMAYDDATTDARERPLGKAVWTFLRERAHGVEFKTGYVKALIALEAAAAKLIDIDGNEVIDKPPVIEPECAPEVVAALTKFFELYDNNSTHARQALRDLVHTVGQYRAPRVVADMAYHVDAVLTSGSHREEDYAPAVELLRFAARPLLRFAARPWLPVLSRLDMTRPSTLSTLIDAANAFLKLFDARATSNYASRNEIVKAAHVLDAKNAAFFSTCGKHTPLTSVVKDLLLVVLCDGDYTIQAIELRRILTSLKVMRGSLTKEQP